MYQLCKEKSRSWIRDLCCDSIISCGYTTRNIESQHVANFVCTARVTHHFTEDFDTSVNDNVSIFERHDARGRKNVVTRLTKRECLAPSSECCLNLIVQLRVKLPLVIRISSPVEPLALRIQDIDKFCDWVVDFERVENTHDELRERDSVRNRYTSRVENTENLSVDHNIGGRIPGYAAQLVKQVAQRLCYRRIEGSANKLGQVTRTAVGNTVGTKHEEQAPRVSNPRDKS